jgi:hypothetical protein
VIASKSIVAPASEERRPCRGATYWPKILEKKWPMRWKRPPWLVDGAAGAEATSGWAVEGVAAGAIGAGAAGAGGAGGTGAGFSPL